MKQTAEYQAAMQSHAEDAWQVIGHSMCWLKHVFAPAKAGS
jgi:hypothetical protein